MSQKNEIQKTSLKGIILNPADELASHNGVLLSRIMPLMNMPTDDTRGMFLEALDRFSVSEKELDEAFWQAYADPYVPATGIEFRHLWKHIKESRTPQMRYEEL